jgi:uncharacterized protein (DUF983 family)
MSVGIQRQGFRHKFGGTGRGSLCADYVASQCTSCLVDLNPASPADVLAAAAIGSIVSANLATGLMRTRQELQKSKVQMRKEVLGWLLKCRVTVLQYR